MSGFSRTKLDFLPISHHLWQVGNSSKMSTASFRCWMMLLKTASSSSLLEFTKKVLKVRKHSEFLQSVLLVQSISLQWNEVILSLVVNIEISSLADRDKVY